MSHKFSTTDTYVDSRVEYNDNIHEMLNDNFGFSNTVNLNEDAISSG